MTLTKIIKTLNSSFTMARVLQWHPTPVLLPGKSHGRRSLVGSSPWGRKKSDTTQWLNHKDKREVYKHNLASSWPRKCLHSTCRISCILHSPVWRCWISLQIIGTTVHITTKDQETPPVGALTKLLVMVHTYIKTMLSTQIYCFRSFFKMANTEFSLYL